MIPKRLDVTEGWRAV